MTTCKVNAAVVVAAVAMALTGCGASSASHVVGGAAQPTVAPSGGPTTVAGSPGTTQAAGTPTSPSTAFSPQTLDQVAAELGAMDNSLNAANSDLSNPQGDS